MDRAIPGARWASQATRAIARNLCEPKPMGLNTIADPTTARAASSRATRAPRSTPATSTPNRCCSPRNSVTASASVVIELGPERGRESPNPGRSTAITSRERRSSGKTGHHVRQLPPRSCSRSNGRPTPARTQCMPMVTPTFHLYDEPCTHSGGSDADGPDSDGAMIVPYDRHRLRAC